MSILVASPGMPRHLRDQPGPSRLVALAVLPATVTASGVCV